MHLAAQLIADDDVRP